MKKSLFIAILTIIFPAQVFAVGSGAFENASFSAASLSQANAVVAQADEPASISYNPAGIVDLPGIQVQSSAAFISIFTRHSGSAGTTYSRGTVSLIPTGYMTINAGKFFNDRVAIGFGSDSPFGLKTRYDSRHRISRYTGFANFLRMYTLKPVAAVKVTDQFSVGAGPVYNRIFDFGGVLAYPNQLVAGGLPDGQVRARTRGGAWGWHLGALLKPHKKHQFGFYFRSPVTVKTRGRIEVENAFVGGNFNTGANAKIDLPLNITVGYAYKPNDRTTIEADFGFTRWSAFERLFINADPVNAADDAVLAAVGKTPKDFRNSFSLHLGGHHKVNEKWTLRGGSFFFWTPIPKTHFIPAIPDSNSLAFTVGAGYNIRKNIVFDLAYMARLWLRRNINNNISEVLGTSVDGKYLSFGQELFLSLTYKLGQGNDSSLKSNNIEGLSAL